MGKNMIHKLIPGRANAHKRRFRYKTILIKELLTSLKLSGMTYSLT